MLPGFIVDYAIMSPEVPLAIPKSHHVCETTTSSFLTDHWKRSITSFVMAQIVPGNRNGKIVVNAGFRYQRNQTRLGIIYWKCWRGDCPSQLTTNVFNANAVNPNIQIQNVTNHNHQVDDATVERNRLSTK